jgi:hypothetical protein
VAFDPEFALGANIFFAIKLKIIFGGDMAKAKETTKKTTAKKPVLAEKKKIPAEKNLPMCQVIQARSVPQ